MTTSNNSVVMTMKKRPLQPSQPPKLRLTNGQWIDCVTTTTTTATTSSSSNNTPASQIRYQARNVCWNVSGSLLAVGCSDSMIRFWNPMSISFDSTTTTNIPCKDVGSINTTITTTTTTATSTTSTSNNNNTTNNHNPPVIAATFHPTSDPILCSMTAGSGTLRLWDVRSSSSNSSSSSSNTANITNTNNITTPNTTTITSSALSHCTIMTSSSSSSSSLPIVVAVEWNPIQTHMISCTTHDGTVSIYDTRKFTNHTTTSTSTTTNNHNNSALVQKIQFPYNDRIESCIFDPVTGEYIMAGITNRGSRHNPNTNKNPSLSSSSSSLSSNSISSNGMGYIKACQWDTIQSNNNKTQPSEHQKPQQWYAYPAHAGPIYTIASSHHQNQHQHRRSSSSGGGGGGGVGASKIATGGSDAVVGIWDVSTMTCTSTISSRTKFIRALAFSYPKNDNDPLLLAIATEEDVIELIDCSTVGGTSSCNSIGCVNLSNTSSIGRRSMMMTGIMAGAEDICFHPTIPNLLACARTTDVATPSGMSSVTLLKFTISSSTL